MHQPAKYVQPIHFEDFSGSQFKLRDASRLSREFEAHFPAAASKYEIPKERYKDYAVLEP